MGNEHHTKRGDSVALTVESTIVLKDWIQLTLSLWLFCFNTNQDHRKKHIYKSKGCPNPKDTIRFNFYLKVFLSLVIINT